MNIQSHIKFQVPSSCGSLVLKQTKGVTDRKGTLLHKYFTEFTQKLIKSS